MAELLLHRPDFEGRPLPAQRIGWISQVGQHFRVSFADDYIADPSRPVLSQLYRGQTEVETRAILSAVKDERVVRLGKLPAFFSNLLPEGSNRTRLASHRGVDETEELELLAAAGFDLSGAVEVRPPVEIPPHVLELHVTQHAMPLEPLAVATPIEEGFSIDGVQTKFSMVHDGRRYVIRHGTAAGEFIAKLPSTKYPDLVTNEATCYSLARAVGITTADAEVRSIAELDVPDAARQEFSEFLLVKRFDRFRRTDGSTGRIHFEELTQALGLDPKQKYFRLPAAMRALLEMLKASDASKQADFDEVFRRWTANALMGNTDAHSKNWGLLYPTPLHCQLAPAYDLVCVAAYFDPADPNALATNRAMDASLRIWNEDQAEALAKDAGLLNFNRARRVVRDTRNMAAAKWPEILERAEPAVRDTVLVRLRELVPAPKSRAQ